MNRRSLLGLLLGASPMKFSGNSIGFQNPPVGNQGIITRPVFKSDNYVAGVSGWAIFRNGNVEFNSGTFRGTVTAGAFIGTTFEIRPAGAFFYSGAPALGNLIASIASTAGVDRLGNAYKAGFATYNNAGGIFGELNNAVLSLGGNGDQQAGAISATGGRMTLFSGLKDAIDEGPQVFLTSKDATGGTGTPNVVISTGNFDMQVGINGGFSSQSPLEVQGISGITDPVIQATNRNIGDNAYGARVFSDSFNRYKVDGNGKTSWGSGASGQDTTLYRAAAGQLAVDTLVANISGSPEVWQTLGPPGITGFTSDRGRFRRAPDGETEIDIILHSNAVAHASSITTYPNALPAAYRPAFNRVYPLGIDTTITAGDPYPRLFIDTSGNVKIAIPSVPAVTTEIGGNIRMPLD